MFGAVLFLSSVAVAFTALQNTARFRETTLKYYNGQGDSAVFAAAVIFCNQRGGSLVMPKYHQLNEAVGQVSNQNKVWIGGEDLYGEGAYEWIDGQRIEWANWNPGEPNNGGNDEDCIHFESGPRKAWNDLNCCQRMGYVCQIPDTKSMPYEYSTFSVFAGKNATSFFEAEKYCRMRRSRVVLLDDDNQLKNLETELSDSSPARFWVARQKDGHLCGMASDHRVYLADCSEELPFICEEVAPHNLTVSDENPEVQILSKLTLECRASGVPTPKVTWYRNGTYVSHQTRRPGSSTLVLKQVTLRDADLYVCKAANRVGGEILRMEGYSFVGVTSILESDIQAETP